MATESAEVHRSFLSIDRYRFAVLPFLVTVGSTGAYLWDSRRQQPSGGTDLGLALGTIAAALILLLMGYGIRRRMFRAGVGNATRWLSLHVYLGLSTLLVASLHCNFQFGRNVHTLTYALLCAVVASGCWGVYAYRRYPTLLVRVRGNSSRDQLLDQVVEFDRQSASLANALPAHQRELVIDSIRRTRIGGGLWTQLRARDESTLMLSPPLHPGTASLVTNEGQRAFIGILSRLHAAGGGSDTRDALDGLLKLAGNKAVAQHKLRRDLQLQGLMQFWLYLHLPLSFGLLMALAVHIFAVFFYR